MATANPLDELRRRIGHGAAPGAFAALAEEHRRAGRLDDAVVVCREGLERYPTYVSARVTLGRALLDLGEVEAAIGELEHAVGQAPDNLAAARALEQARALAPPPAPDAGAAVEPPPEPGAMAWLTRSEDGEPDGGHIVASFASERPPLDVEDAATADGAGLATGAETWDDTLYPPVAPLDGWADQAAPPAATLVDPSAEVADEPTGGDEGLGGWGAVALPQAPEEAAVAPWGSSVDAAVAEVFARAGGDAVPTPVETDAHDGRAATPLDTLEGLLESIRARRSTLAGLHSGVD